MKEREGKGDREGGREREREREERERKRPDSSSCWLKSTDSTHVGRNSDAAPDVCPYP